MNDRHAPARSTTSGGALRELAKAIAGLSLESDGQRVVDAAKRRVFDTLGAVCLGFATPEGQALLALDAELAADARARDALARCRLLGGAARTTEIDDIDVASCTTVGCVAVSAALGLAAARTGTCDRDLLAAVVAGYEATIRLGRAIGGALLLYRGVWPTYATAAFGSAAAAAKLLGLEAERTAQALALAVARAGGLPAGSSAQFAFRYYALGGAVADGCAAALAAASGVRGDAGDLAAFAARIEAPLDEAELTDGLGDAWRLWEVETKMLPSARQALASVEAFIALDPEADASDEIERVVVSVPPAYRAMVDRPQLPARRIESLLSVQYQIALAAVDRGALYDALREPVRRDASIEALMARIEVRSDDELAAQFPRHWGSIVQLRRRGGAESRAALVDPPNARDAPWNALQRKLERIFAASGLRPGRALDVLLAECRSLGDGGGAGAAARLVGAVDSFLVRPVAAAGQAAGAS